MTSALVLPLDDPAAELDLVGGKGASLARLAVAGLPVPTGFHVTTDAYRLVTGGGPEHEILGALEGLDMEDDAAVERASDRIRKVFAGLDVPAEVADAIRAAYADMAEPAVAVRSSATAEDLPGMSFAGQQDTYLNIRGEQALLAAVKDCWASLWNARALAYRARNGVPSKDVALAVVVQELVPAEAAGVLFTANPLSGARDELVVNAAWGLGETVVGGQVTPDTYVVERAGGGVIERRIGDKTVMTVRTDGEPATRPCPRTGARWPCSTTGRWRSSRGSAYASRSCTALRWMSNGPPWTGSSPLSRRGRSPICGTRRTRTRSGTTASTGTTCGRAETLVRPSPM